MDIGYILAGSLLAHLSSAQRIATQYRFHPWMVVSDDLVLSNISSAIQYSFHARKQSANFLVDFLLPIKLIFPLTHQLLPLFPNLFEVSGQISHGAPEGWICKFHFLYLGQHITAACIIIPRFQTPAFTHYLHAHGGPALSLF